MADLLECVIQIKALAETPRRLTRMVESVPEERWRARPQPGVWAPVEVVAHLADAELVSGFWLRAMLTSDRPALGLLDLARLASQARYQDWPVERALDRFCRRRHETLELLEVCSAADLGRTALHLKRGVITVADHVAAMLAHDTDHVGQIRARLGIDSAAD